MIKDLLAKIFKTKTIDLEAKLRPIASCTFGGVGEIEIECWSDGTGSIELSLKHAGVPDGTKVEFSANGVPLGNGLTVGGFLKQRISVTERDLPNVKVGDTGAIVIDGQTLYSGTFHRD